jgi:hypothetical protein
MWMFWSVLLIVAGIILLNLQFNLNFSNYKPESVARAEEKPAEVDVGKMEKVVDFTKKAACMHNVQAIETQVELWYILRGSWPKNDFSDIGRDMDHFPKGVPKCPVTGEPYTLDPVSHRIMGHSHGEIESPDDEMAGKNAHERF